MKELVLGAILVGLAIAIGFQIGSPGKRLYERPAAYGDRVNVR